MILAWLNEQSFEYDIRGLLTSFYPGKEVKVIFADPDDEDASGEPVSIPDNDQVHTRLSIKCDIASGMADVLLDAADTSHLEVHIEATPEDRMSMKRALKIKLYELLTQETGHELPWGTLTGIRPTNIVLKLLEQGGTCDEAERVMREDYLVGPQKTALSLEIAGLEHNILSGFDLRDSWSLYVGIPFCPTRCLYCSFASNPIDTWKNKTEDYLSSIEKELSLYKEIFSGRTLHTVYVGGGTPTSLSASEIDRLLWMIAERFDIGTLREFCVEAGRPDTVTREKMQILKKYGVSRISINPQSMKQKTLDLIGRRHTAEQTREAFYLAREENFDNINMDIILGLPEENVSDVEYTLEEIANLAPEALTVHSLALKRSSRLNLEKENRDAYAPSKALDMEEAMSAAEAGARAMGMRPYYLYRQKNMAGNLENVGFSKPGHEGLYNILMMEEKESIAAAGAGTISKRVFQDGTITRADNVKDAKLYMERLTEMLERKKRLFV